MKDFIVGTAGHIDHGKTTLLKALTGIDADRLQEEKRRGITIDIGFAHLALGSYRLGFIDVPGHEKFVKNMLAGVGGIHLVLLIVAADESVMPQTIEHFEICKLLGIPRGIVVLTKKNLVEQELLPLVEEEVRDLARGSFLEGSPILHVDSVSGDGIEQLKEALLKEVQELEENQVSHRSQNMVFRLPVDRVFSMKGFGTVVTGTLWSGSLQKETPIAAYPQNKPGKVRRIEVFNQEEPQAFAGQRTALNLTGMDRVQLERGTILSHPDCFSPSHHLDAKVYLLEGAPKPLKHRSPIRFHHGSGEWIGRLYLLEKDPVVPGGSAIVQIRLDQPVVCMPRDRFILRRYSPMRTIGGGIILDNAPPKHRKKELPQVLSSLQELDRSLVGDARRGDLALLEFLVQSKGWRGIVVPELVSRTGYREEHLLSLLARLETVLLVPQDPGLALSRSSLDALKQRITAFLEEFHRAHPLAVGVSREEVKKRFLGTASSSYFQFVVQALEQEDLVQTRATTLAIHGRKVELGPKQEQMRQEILDSIDRSFPEPPSLRELIQSSPHPSEEVKSIFYYLLEKGELIRISEKLVATASQIDGLKKKLSQKFGRGRAFTVPEFKDLFKISRKYAIPFLEYLDRERVTQRQGDQRILR